MALQTSLAASFHDLCKAQNVGLEKGFSRNITDAGHIHFRTAAGIHFPAVHRELAFFRNWNSADSLFYKTFFGIKDLKLDLSHFFSCTRYDLRPVFMTIEIAGLKYPFPPSNFPALKIQAGTKNFIFMLTSKLEVGFLWNFRLYPQENPFCLTRLELDPFFTY